MSNQNEIIEKYIKREAHFNRLSKEELKELQQEVFLEIAQNEFVTGDEIRRTIQKQAKRIARKRNREKQTLLYQANALAVNRGALTR